jgi:nitronate monooxygenase/enoyl-[acyl-carrier protein] reductase II
MPIGTPTVKMGRSDFPDQERGMLRTRLCDVLGIDVPIICAPFGPWDEVDLAAAVCAAGGLGSLGTAARPLPDLRQQWARLRALTDRPFAINHTTRPFDSDAFEATLEERPAVISFHMGDPGELVARAQAIGARWVQQVMDVDQARQAVERGVDVIVAQGWEAGGHSGQVSTLALVPQVVDIAGAIPVVMAGGVGDGRGLAVALTLGAQGVAMGTRFLASREMCVSDEWKQWIVAAQSTDSVKADLMDALLPPFNRSHYSATARILRTRFLEQWGDRPDDLRARAGEFAPQLLAALQRGDGHEFIPFTGQSAGLVHDILPAAEIVRRTIDEAEVAIAGLQQYDHRAAADTTGRSTPSRRA